MKFVPSSLSVTAVATAALLSAGGALAAPELPKSIAVTAYDVGSSGYSQAVAVGAAFKNNYGVTLRVLPGKNDVSRTVPLREGKVDFSFNGIGTYFAQEGVDVFGTKGWGPQEARILLMSMGGNCITQFVAEDVGVKTLAGLKGKGVARVKGSPALNTNTLAHLRFAGLTWDDVTPVDVGGNSAAFDAILNNQADSFLSTTNSGSILKTQNSPRGVFFPPLPHNDEEGWKRVHEVAPYYTKHVCTESAGNMPAWEGASYPYPVLMTYPKQSADDAYAITKAMFEQYPNYKDAAPAAAGYALENQVLKWVVPYHEGAIRFYKEAGKWGEAEQANQDELLARQDALKKIWAEFSKSEPKGDFYDAWMAARYEGMKAAGLNPIWKEFK
ncbi:TAXI family TRAP transporter solute-binding subunit [Constrictibacter sp. MBR-5]|jgi:TRAP transporter TAXI family solute receptor|uniref:TAXI family TRAP transporter solute-binding subunit n=1 Tax=Constrictibacter sp. MBR-5 TaxID=3156467 RepID=UPI003398194B